MQADRNLRRFAQAAPLAALAMLAATGPLRAQTVLSGHYDNSPNAPANFDGYNATTPGTYIATDTATFSQDVGSGLLARGNGVTLTVNGSQFDSETSGLFVGNGATATITGGQFSGDEYALTTVSSATTVSIYGGVFTNDTLDFLNNNGGNITLYGTFAQYGSLNTLGASGTFTGTLANESQAQTFSYVNYGTLTLAPVPAPEPASWAAFAFTGLFAAGLILRASRRQSAGAKRRAVT